MALSDFEKASQGAGKVAQAVRNMNSIHNAYWPDYTDVLANVRATYGDGMRLADMSDDQINAFFLAGYGDAETIAEIKTAIAEWEKNLLQLDATVKVLPANV